METVIVFWIGSENSGNVELIGECGWDLSIHSILTLQGTVTCANSLKLNFNCNMNKKNVI